MTDAAGTPPDFPDIPGFVEVLIVMACATWLLVE